MPDDLGAETRRRESTRRIDDDFIRSLAFRSDSTLGVPGVFNAYRAGNVVIANAPDRRRRRQGGYAYVPRLIRY